MKNEADEIDMNARETVPAIEYASVCDDAREMAFILRKISQCLHEGCMCGGDYDGGIPYEDTVSKLCRIMYMHNGCMKKYLIEKGEMK